MRQQSPCTTASGGAERVGIDRKIFAVHMVQAERILSFMKILRVFKTAQPPAASVSGIVERGPGLR